MSPVFENMEAYCKRGEGQATSLSSKLLKQGYLAERLKSSFRKFYGNSFAASFLINLFSHFRNTLNTTECLLMREFKKSRCVCETLCPRRQKSMKKVFFAKVKVKVTSSLTLVSFERASLLEYACQI